jgi:hypothetical protein
MLSSDVGGFGTEIFVGFLMRSQFEMATLKGMCWRTNWIVEKVI